MKADEPNVVKSAKESMKKKHSLLCTIDDTIEILCMRVQKNDFAPDYYAEEVKALAALVEARFKIS